MEAPDDYATPQPTLLFECKKRMGGHRSADSYEIKVTQTDSHLFIHANREPKPQAESYVIELANENVETILGEFDGDLEQMCNNLEVLNKRLVLLNPKSHKAKRPR